MTDNPNSPHSLAPAVLLACVLACGCRFDPVDEATNPVTPATTLTAMATKATRDDRALTAKAFDDLAVKAKSFKSSAELKAAWKDAIHEARMAAWEPTVLATDKAGATDSKYDAAKTSKAMSDIAAGVRKAGK